MIKYLILILVFVIGTLFYIFKYEKGPKIVEEKFEIVKRPVGSFKESSGLSPIRKTPLKFESIEQREENSQRNELSDEELADLEKYFDKIEKKWTQKVEAYFKENFPGENVFNEFSNLRDRFEEEKVLAYENFHERMLDKFGEDYEFRPTEIDDKEVREINDRYEDELKNLLGEEHFQTYIEMREDFNEQIRKNQSDQFGYMAIEF